MGIDIHGLMLHNIRMRLLIILPLLLSFLSACVPTTTRDDDTQIGAEIREIEENALLLFESGRYSEAATEYLNLSKKNKKRFTFYIVKAIDAYAKEKRYNKASEIVKNNTPDNQDTELNKRIAILNAYDQLESGKPGGALSLLGELSEYEVPENFKIAYHEFLAKANLTHGNYIKAAVEQLKLAKYLVSTKMIDNNTRIVWGIFESISKLELEDLRINAPDELISWFELSLISQTYKYQPKKLENAIDGWAQRYQNHYAHRLITNELINKSMQLVQRPSKIGLLLPIKGKHKKSATAVRDGFLAAWYLDKQEKADIQIYDANNINIIEVYQQALKDGVDYIVGPLEKEAVNQLYDNTDISVKILALNRQDQKEAQSSNKNLIQFGLSPEDEAIQIAKIAMSDGHKRALVLTPETPWGNRLADTFIQHWIELGGEISKQISFLDNTTDFSTPVKELLNIDKSEQRARDLRNKLNIKIHNVERRRKDVDFIFTAAVPEDARQLIPQIRFHRADNLPIYSTSDIYTGIIDSAKDIDLNDVIFVDMPWILDSERQLSIIQDVLNRNWSQEKSRYRRLYALGVDAYNLIPDINRLIQEQNSLMLGETGNLTIDSANIVKRNNLRKAKFVEGKPILQN
tara:strand:+ start:4243 stop:6138 length:1896 start_codon:yes stop_codon:yes gene_type:complete